MQKFPHCNKNHKYQQTLTFKIKVTFFIGFWFYWEVIFADWSLCSGLDSEVYLLSTRREFILELRLPLVFRRFKTRSGRTSNVKIISGCLRHSNNFLLALKCFQTFFLLFLLSLLKSFCLFLIPVYAEWRTFRGHSLCTTGV